MKYYLKEKNWEHGISYVTEESKEYKGIWMTEQYSDTSRATFDSVEEAVSFLKGKESLGYVITDFEIEAENPNIVYAGIVNYNINGFSYKEKLVAPTEKRCEEKIVEFKRELLDKVKVSDYEHFSYTVNSIYTEPETIKVSDYLERHKC